MLRNTERLPLKQADKCVACNPEEPVHCISAVILSQNDMCHRFGIQIAFPWKRLRNQEPKGSFVLSVPAFSKRTRFKSYEARSGGCDWYGRFYAYSQTRLCVIPSGRLMAPTTAQQEASRCSCSRQVAPVRNVLLPSHRISEFTAVRRQTES